MMKRFYLFLALLISCAALGGYTKRAGYGGNLYPPQSGLVEWASAPSSTLTGINCLSNDTGVDGKACTLGVGFLEDDWFLELIIYRGSASGTLREVITMDNGTFNMPLRFGTTSENLGVTINGVNLFTGSGETFPVGEWSRVITKRVAGLVTVAAYEMDGTLRFSTEMGTDTNAIVNTRTLEVGGYTSGRFFSGRIAGLRYGSSESDIIASYTFAEGDGLPLDGSGGGKHATVNTMDWDTDDVLNRSVNMEVGHTPAVYVSGVLEEPLTNEVAIAGGRFIDTSDGSVREVAGGVTRHSAVLNEVVDGEIVPLKTKSQLAFDGVDSYLTVPCGDVGETVITVTWMCPEIPPANKIVIDTRSATDTGNSVVAVTVVTTDTYRLTGSSELFLPGVWYTRDFPITKDGVDDIHLMARYTVSQELYASLRFVEIAGKFSLDLTGYIGKAETNIIDSSGQGNAGTLIVGAAGLDFAWGTRYADSGGVVLDSENFLPASWEGGVLHNASEPSVTISGTDYAYSDLKGWHKGDSITGPIKHAFIYDAEPANTAVIDLYCEVFDGVWTNE